MAKTARKPLPTLREGLDALATGRAAGAEDVHELHRRLRRERLERRLRNGGRPHEGLRELERALGVWRDLSLFRATLRAAEPARLRAEDRSWKRVAYARALAEERAARTTALRKAAEVARLGVPRAGGPRSGPPARLRADRPRRALANALRRARERLSARRAHDLRKEMRRFGFLRDLVAVAEGREAGRRPSAVRRLIAALGRLHDLDVALERLRAYPRGGARWRRRLALERARLEPKIRRALRSGGVARFARGR